MYINKKVDIVTASGGFTDLELSKNASNNKNSSVCEPKVINNTVGDKKANATKQVKLRRYDVNGNQIN